MSFNSSYDDIVFSRQKITFINLDFLLIIKSELYMYKMANDEVRNIKITIQIFEGD